jgi:hypothetical protein
MTAYSTAVGPSSSRRNREALANHLLITLSPFQCSEVTEPARGWA